MIVGYARVSTLDQNPELQIDALNAYGCERIFIDKISGASSIRPELEKALDILRPGDTFVVWKLDRFGRSMQDLLSKIQSFKDKGVSFCSLSDPIDTSTPQGMLVFHLFSALAEFERNLIRERTKAGLEAARARGIVGGRKPKLNEKEIKKLLLLYNSQTMTTADICKLFGISKPTLYAYLRNHKDKQ